MMSFFRFKSQKFDELYERSIKLRDKKSIFTISREAEIEACLQLFCSEFDPNEVSEEGTLLSSVIGTGRIDFVRFVVEKGADVNLYHDESGYPLENALHPSLQEIFDYLEPLTSLEVKQELLMGATTSWEYLALPMLIDSGLDVNLPQDGIRALTIAVQLGNPKIVEILLRAGADPNLLDLDATISPLICAVECQYVHIISLLLEYGADIELINSNGETALEIALNLKKRNELSPKKELRNKKIIELLRSFNGDNA